MASIKLPLKVFFLFFLLQVEYNRHKAIAIYAVIVDQERCTMNLFETVPGNFFSVLSSKNKELYFEALMLLHKMSAQKKTH